MSIICGTDFSQQAAQAVDVAAALAASLGEELRIIYAFDKRSSEKILASAEEVVLATIRHRLRGEVERLRRNHNEVDGEILTGAPDEALAEAAASSDASLLVVSATGSRSASFWTLGSVAERTARTATCPVLVVRDAAPFLQWSRGERPLRVVAGVDATSASDASVLWLRELRRIGPCEVTFVHLYDGMDAGRDALEQNLSQRLAQLGEERPKLIVQPNAARSPEPLTRIAHDLGADLLVVGNNRGTAPERATHGSISYAALHLARMSVASVPAGTAAEEQNGQKTEVRRVVAAAPTADEGLKVAEFAATFVPAGGTLLVVAPVGSGSEQQLRERLTAALRDQLSGRTLQVEVVAAEDFARSVHEAAERGDADLICATAETGEKLLRLTRRPLLVVRT